MKTELYLHPQTDGDLEGLRVGNLHWFCQGMSGSGSVNKTASILREMLKVFANISCLIVWDRTIEDYLLMKLKQL